MKPRATTPWTRLSLLAAVVLAGHLALLQAAPERLAPAREALLHFVTRTIAPEPVQPLAAAVTPPMSAAVPVTLPAARPSVAAAAPRPRRQPVAAPAPAQAAAPAAKEPQEPQAALAPTPVPAPAAEAPLLLAAATPAAGSTAATAAAPFVPRVQAVPPSLTLRYEVTAHWHGFPISGKSRLEWRHDEKTYSLRWEVTSAGLPTRLQRSEGALGADGLNPSYFADKVRSEQATHFDRDHNRLVFSNNAPSQPIEAGMQDRLSVILQLSVLIAGQPARFPKGAQLAIPVVGTREAEGWVFSVEGEENLQLPGGAVRALKLQRMPRKQYDQKVELWLAPHMDYAPVRLRLTNPDGDAVDSRWSSTDRR